MCENDMFDSFTIRRLYDTVLHNDMIMFQVSDQDIRTGIRNMGKAYSVECANFNCDVREFPNFNNSAFRCAYLHKYAPLHTYMVFNAMVRILQVKGALFLDLISSGRFNFCCLGGGPGSDAIGVLAALRSVFNSFKSSANIIDCMSDWEYTFASLIKELKIGNYGRIWRNFGDFSFNYIGADLLQSMTNKVSNAIASASFITMVKFVSAASCTNAEQMIEKIFHIMKPGAIVLFIDNAAGGFTQAVERASKKNGFQDVIDQRHVPYENQVFQTERFGHAGCYKTKVTILLLKKPLHQHSKFIAPAPPIAQSRNSNKLSIKEDNLNHNVIKNDSHKSPIKDSNLNQNSRKTVSSKSPIKENNLNQNPRKNVSTKSPIKESNINQNSKKTASNCNQLPITRSNFNQNSRQTDFPAVNNQNRSNINGLRHTVSSRVTPQYSNYVPQIYSTTNSSDFRYRERNLDQTSANDKDDADETSCSCCVIS